VPIPTWEGQFYHLMLPRRSPRAELRYSPRSGSVVLVAPRPPPAAQDSGVAVEIYTKEYLFSAREFLTLCFQVSDDDLSRPDPLSSIVRPLTVYNLSCVHDRIFTVGDFLVPNWVWLSCTLRLLRAAYRPQVRVLRFGQWALAVRARDFHPDCRGVWSCPRRFRRVSELIAWDFFVGLGWSGFQIFQFSLPGAAGTSGIPSCEHLHAYFVQLCSVVPRGTVFPQRGGYVMASVSARGWQITTYRGDLDSTWGHSSCLRQHDDGQGRPHVHCRWFFHLFKSIHNFCCFHQR